MRSGATPASLDMIEDLLRRFAAGEVDRRLLMDRLDVTYSEMLDMLHQRRLQLPRTPDLARATMAQTLNRLLDEARD